MTANQNLYIPLHHSKMCAMDNGAKQENQEHENGNI